MKLVRHGHYFEYESKYDKINENVEVLIWKII